MTPRSRALVAAVIAGTVSIGGYIGTKEGKRLEAYLDPGGIPTICHGETQGVELGDVATDEECADLLAGRVEEFRAKVKRCIRRPMPKLVEDAFTSTAYNIGASAFCGSSIARLWNDGHARAACERITQIGTRTKTTGKELPGLVIRRAEESAICLGGLS